MIAPDHIRQITITATGSVYQVNELKRLSDIQHAEPGFFAITHGKRETYAVYRGQLIVKNTVKYTDWFGREKPERRIIVYLFIFDHESDSWSTLHADNVSSIYKAKKLIDQILEDGHD